MLRYFNNQKINSKFKFINANINTDLKKISSSIKKYRPEVIVNFIAQGEVRTSWKYPNHWYQTNCMSIINLTNEIYNYSFIKKYIAISTPESLWILKK